MGLCGFAYGVVSSSQLQDELVELAGRRSSQGVGWFDCIPGLYARPPLRPKRTFDPPQSRLDAVSTWWGA